MCHKRIVKQIPHDIATTGRSIICIGGDGSVPYAYTIGCAKDNTRSELLIFGLRDDVASAFLNEIDSRRCGGETFVDEAPIHEVSVLPLALKRISKEAASAFALLAFDYYKAGPITPAFDQVVLSDPKGLLPWQPGHVFSPGQPLLWLPPADAHQPVWIRRGARANQRSPARRGT